MLQKNIKVGEKLYSHSQLGNIFKDFEGKMGTQAGNGPNARCQERGDFEGKTERSGRDEGHKSEARFSQGANGIFAEGKEQNR